MTTAGKCERKSRRCELPRSNVYKRSIRFRRRAGRVLLTTRMATNGRLPPIVFPENDEFLARRPNRRRDLSLKHVLAVLYAFGGVSALLTILSKFVIQPLFLQLSEDRRSYASVAIAGLRALNSKLSAMVSYNPPIRESLAGEKYADAETQTEEQDTKGKDDIFSEEKPVEREQHDLLNEHLTELSSKSAIAETDSVKSALEELNSLVLGLGFRGVSTKAIKLDNRSESPDIATDVKKEIRSIKGSLLSTRSLPNPN